MNATDGADCNDFGGCRGSQERTTLPVLTGEVIIIRSGTSSPNVTASGSLGVSCIQAPLTLATSGPATTTAPQSDSTTTIIAVVVSVGGLWLIAVIVAGVVVAKLRSTNAGDHSAEADTTQRKQVAPNYDSASSSTLTAPKIDYTSSDSYAYVSPPPPASVLDEQSNSSTTMTQKETGSKSEDSTSSSTKLSRKAVGDDAPKKQQLRESKKSHKSKKHVVELASDGSLVRKSSRPDDVPHIPIGEVSMGKKLGEGAFGVVLQGHLAR